ncbi:hypothetical protein LR48_Vigan06g093600 [Vigna angularis]|uniref:Uncharacterized protein n=1 Tax=Phaseolus angularis TaxID=3914 RepID=A0A0L9URX7_PHAAN|nr:hypothetical protein LR48_Vigan06g093600 [Vigna angularis]
MEDFSVRDLRLLGSSLQVWFLCRFENEARRPRSLDEKMKMVVLSLRQWRRGAMKVAVAGACSMRTRKAIDETYYRQYCGGDEAAQPVPPHCPRRGRGPPWGQASAEIHEAEPFQMRDMWTMDEFHNVVASPEEQAQGSRAGATEASAMDDDEDDEEEDTFEDVEDDGEEEDTDDNMG